MRKPVLAIMAAGMGSRYGGLKQIDPIDEQGHLIIDFSLFDARKAGFEQVIFIIKKEDEMDFKEVIGNRIEKKMEVTYVFQDLHNIPKPYEVPCGRIKPWGTAHAVLSCKNEVSGPFAVINADDYYGATAFQIIYEYLATHEDDNKFRYAMVGYTLGNTLTENGHVARGICTMDESGELIEIHERVQIEEKKDGPAYTEDDGKSWVKLEKETIVSMNMWGFSHSIFDGIEDGLSEFLEEGMRTNPMKCEYFLPIVVSNLMKTDRATVEVLITQDKWYGVTYKKDKPVIEEAIKEMKARKLYPEQLWSEE